MENITEAAVECSDFTFFHIKLFLIYNNPKLLYQRDDKPKYENISDIKASLSNMNKQIMDNCSVIPHSIKNDLFFYNQVTETQ